MSIIDSSSTQATNWKQLSYFRVFVENDAHLQNARYPLLNNKRQQLRVTVRLAAKDAAGNVATIPKSDLDQIRLIDYNTSALIDYNDNFSGDWTSSWHHRGFIWDRGFLDSIRSLRLEQPQLFETSDSSADDADYADDPDAKVSEPIEQTSESFGPVLISPSMDATLADCPGGYQCVTFYVSTGARAARRLAARITNGDGTVFRSNYSDVTDDLGEGDKRGRFNSSFEVEPVSFPSLPNENFGDRKADGSGYLRDTLVTSNKFSGGEYRAFEQHVNIRMPNGRKVPIKSVTSHPSGADGAIGGEMMWASRGPVTRSKTTFTYISYPGETHVRMQEPPNWYGADGYFYRVHSLLATAFPNFTPRIFHPRAGEVVIGHFLTDQNHQFYYRAQNGAEHQVPNKMMMPLHVMDIYGTEHRLRLGLVSTHNYLTLNKV